MHLFLCEQLALQLSMDYIFPLCALLCTLLWLLQRLLSGVDWFPLLVLMATLKQCSAGLWLSIEAHVTLRYFTQPLFDSKMACIGKIMSSCLPSWLFILYILSTSFCRLHSKFPQIIVIILALVPNCCKTAWNQFKCLTDNGVYRQKYATSENSCLPRTSLWNSQTNNMRCWVNNK